MSGTISYTGGLGGVKSGKGKASKCRHFSLSPLQEGIPSAPPSPPHYLKNPQENQPQVCISSLVPGTKRWCYYHPQPRKWSWRVFLPSPVDTDVKSLPGSWSAFYVRAFVVWHCPADFWTTSFDHFLIVSYWSLFPLDLWTYGMSYDNDFNVCLQVLHLFLFWLIGFTY